MSRKSEGKEGRARDDSRGVGMDVKKLERIWSERKTWGRGQGWDERVRVRRVRGGGGRVYEEVKAIIFAETPCVRVHGQIQVKPP